MRGERWRRAEIVIGVVLLLVAGGLVVWFDHGSSEPNGPFASQSDRMIAPTGSDESDCRPETPCASLERIAEVAEDGDVVGVASGTYGPQTIFSYQRGFTGQLTIQGDPSEPPVLDELSISGSNITVRDIRANRWNVEAPAEDVVFDHVSARYFTIQGVNRMTVRDSEFGPHRDGRSAIIPEDDGRVARDVVLDGVSFHDYSQTTDGEDIECLMAASVDGLVIRNARFHRCSTENLFITEYPAGPTQRVLIENTWFDTSRGGGFYALSFAARTRAIRDVTVRYNSMLQPIGFPPGIPMSNVRVVGNIGSLPMYEPCQEGVVFSHNLWVNGTCGATDRAGYPRFVDVKLFDLRLTSGSPAIDYGDPNDMPADDITGRTRPVGRGPDVGAWERP